MSTSPADRSALRNHLRTTRSALPASVQAASSRSIVARLESLFEVHQPATVAGYLAIGGELDVAEALAECRRNGRQTFLPVLAGGSLVFSRFDDSTVFTPNRFGIGEPITRPGEPTDHRLAPLELDMVLVPLVGFDLDCERMGMGGGFYDRSFARRQRHAPPPWLIGVAYECQRVDSVHPEEWDVRLDAVVTESNIHLRADA